MSTTVLNGLHSSKNRLPYLDICQATFHHLFNGNVISLFSFVHRLSSRFYFLKTKLVNTMLSTDRDTKYKSDSRSLKKTVRCARYFQSSAAYFHPSFFRFRYQKNNSVSLWSTKTTCVLSPTENNHKSLLFLCVNLCDKHSTKYTKTSWPLRSSHGCSVYLQFSLSVFVQATIGLLHSRSHSKGWFFPVWQREKKSSQYRNLKRSSKS